MRKKILLGLAFLSVTTGAVGPALAGDVVWPSNTPPAVNGISLDSSEAAVLGKLGKPQKQTSAQGEMAGMEDTKTFTYAGLAIDLNRLDEKGFYRVWRFVASGKEWTVSPGIRIGMTKKDVARVLGNFTTEPVDGVEKAFFTTKDGTGNFIWISFKKDLVVEIGYSEDYS